MGVSKTSYQIQMRIKMPNPSKEPPASSKAPNEDLKEMDVLCSFQIKIESQNSDHELWIMNLSKTSDHIQIMIKIQNPSQEPPASSKAQNQDFNEFVRFYYPNLFCSDNLRSILYSKSLLPVFDKPMTQIHDYI